MKKMLLFLSIVCVGCLALISCSKSTLGILVKDKWSGYYVSDSVFAGSEDSAKQLMVNCPGDTKWDADTTVSYNHGEPQAVPTTWQELSPGDMHYISVVEIAPGVWHRIYFYFKQKLVS